MRRTGSIIATGLLLTAGCSGENEPQPTAEQLQASLSAELDTSGVTVEPGTILSIPVAPETEDFDQASRWLVDYIAVPMSASAGGLFSADREVIVRRYDGDLIETGELVHAHTTSDAPCAEFGFEEPVVSVELLANSDGYAAQFEPNAQTLLVCDDRPEDGYAMLLRVNRDEQVAE